MVRSFILWFMSITLGEVSVTYILSVLNISHVHCDVLLRIGRSIHGDLWECHKRKRKEEMDTDFRHISILHINLWQSKRDDYLCQ
jgi:hypothetical protein